MITPTRRHCVRALVLSCVASVATAWVFSLTYRTSPELRQSRYPGTGWLVSRETTAGTTHVLSFALPRGMRVATSLPVDPIPPWSVGSRSPDPSELMPSTLARVYEEAYGWPWRCLMSRSTFEGDVESMLGPWNQRGAIPLGQPDRRASTFARRPFGVPLSLPITPLPKGLMLNVLVMLTPSLMLVLGVESLLHRVRARLGRCRACGYDRFEGGSTCPECGSQHPAGRRSYQSAGAHAV